VVLAMVRSSIAFLLLAAAGVFSRLPAAADDPIAAELSKAREEYSGATGKNREALLAAFDKEIKAAETSKRKVEDIVKITERLQADRDAFKANPWVLSQYSLMKDEVTTYRTKQTAARARLEKAFEAAIEKYQKNKDIESAKATLKRKQEWLVESTPFTFEGVWKSIHTEGGRPPWTGIRTVKADKVLDFDRTECKWERNKYGQVIVTWPGGGWERLDIDFKNPTKLTGKTNGGRISTWTLQK
jgi:hypothetical protein